MSNQYAQVREELNKTGCGMCLAKWTQVTLHLATGMTHSCHHPVPHKIPLAELKRNPSALHNTRYKKEKRKEKETVFKTTKIKYEKENLYLHGRL